MQALVIRISRDVYVLDITVNFMLNKRKSKKAAGAVPQTPLGELSALPQTPLLSREGTPPPVPSPVVNIRPPPPPLSQNPGSAPACHFLFMLMLKYPLRLNSSVVFISLSLSPILNSHSPLPPPLPHSPFFWQIPSGSCEWILFYIYLFKFCTQQ